MYIYAYLICVLLLSNAVKISACAIDPHKLWHAATHINSPWPLLMQQARFVCTDNALLHDQHVKKIDNVVQRDKQQPANSSARKKNRD